MQIKRFEIENYRAIRQVTLNLGSSLTPIIGVNESGKTSILNAIVAFDQTRDRQNNGRHLKYQNRYAVTDTKNSRITAVMLLDQNELKGLISVVGADPESDAYSRIVGYDACTELSLTRMLDIHGKPYVFSDDLLGEDVRKKIADYLRGIFPFILYFDDFTDRVPEKIEIPQESKSSSRGRPSNVAEWREIISEIFRRAMPDVGAEIDDPLTYYLGMDDRQRRKGILSDIQNELNKEIIDEWHSIRRQGNVSLADDSGELTLSIDNEGNVFWFDVEDSAMQGKERIFTVQERSKGFQWFFNYMIKLKYNPRYRRDSSNTLFLLDEPGSYLHSSAQIELLKELKNVSKSNTIIYCTHSEHLLNPMVVRLGSIRIAEKRGGEVILHEYGQYPGKKDAGALSPVYQALHLHHSPEFVGKIVVVEGIVDYYLFEAVKAHSNLVEKDVRFVPGAGALHLSALISQAIAFADQFWVFLDNDTKGKQGAKKYKSEFGDFIAERVHLYHSDTSLFRLEDHLSKGDQDKLKTLTSCNDLKRALGSLHYDHNDKQAEFIAQLSNESVFKLKATLSVLASG